MARVRVGTVSELADGRLHGVSAGGTPVVVGLAGGSLCAARDRCPHLGLSLSRGPAGVGFSEGEVRCPWHNSRFDLCTGENRDWATGFGGRRMPRWSHALLALGRKPAPLTTYRVEVDGEDVFVDV